ncbi:myb-like dna-binding [Plasmopara halstedii]|uniref:Myb-like dna-binding n=1 Tax=Plasmopara halstedii TaxID=4781 RepID=A0A0P1B330_PLAHL|nr:myb-like dna-binding [Plasmopara halstedii]CEG49156.1 myb-like dna-binding [Plasmopara halstedii]|eukprot:XP_024585525.1 myb-like dna-binding [Plasmopara halstedii]
MMPTSTHEGSVTVRPAPNSPITRGLWSEQEHEQFLHAMKMFPTGPWRSIAAFIGTRSIKQVQTHAQKYQQKINRRRRGLRKQKKKFVRPEHRVDAHATGCIQRLKNFTAQGSPRSPSAYSIGPMSPMSSFGQLLMGGCSPVASDEGSIISSSSSSFDDLDVDFDLDELLGEVEPLPFTPDISIEQALNDIDYRQDVQESIDLLLD